MLLFSFIILLSFVLFVLLVFLHKYKTNDQLNTHMYWMWTSVFELPAASSCNEYLSGSFNSFGRFPKYLTLKQIQSQIWSLHLCLLVCKLQIFKATKNPVVLFLLFSLHTSEPEVVDVVLQILSKSSSFNSVMAHFFSPRLHLVSVVEKLLSSCWIDSGSQFPAKVSFYMLINMLIRVISCLCTI